MLEEQIGKVYNSLSVVSFKEHRGKHKIYTCRCTCGKTIDVYLCNLRSGHTKSCGSSQHRIKTIVPGERYGKWTVVNFAYTKNKTAFWNCVCDCGTHRKVRGTMLRSKRSTNCGCINKHNLIQRITTHGMTGTIEYRQWEHKRRREQKKKFDTYWTPFMEKRLRELFPFCTLCGTTQEEHLKKWGKSLHVDHVIPLHAGGSLRPGNATVLCNTCNTSKGHKQLQSLNVNDQQKLLLASYIFKEVYKTIED